MSESWECPEHPEGGKKHEYAFCFCDKKMWEQSLIEAKSQHEEDKIWWMKKAEELKNQLSTHQAMLERLVESLKYCKSLSCLPDSTKSCLEDYQTMKKGAGK